MSQIIFLNGPSSAGKTTLAKALQQHCTPYYLHIGIDWVIEMMPDKSNNWDASIPADGFWWKKIVSASGQEKLQIQSGPFGEKISETFRSIVSLLSNFGHHVIVDEVAFTAIQMEKWREALKGCEVLWVGVTAPLEILEQRELKRGDRPVGSTRAQMETIHKGVAYDLMIDTEAVSLDGQTQMILQRLSPESLP